MYRLYEAHEPIFKNISLLVQFIANLVYTASNQGSFQNFH